MRLHRATLKCPWRLELTLPASEIPHRHASTIANTNTHFRPDGDIIPVQSTLVLNGLSVCVCNPSATVHGRPIIDSGVSITGENEHRVAQPYLAESPRNYQWRSYECDIYTFIGCIETLVFPPSISISPVVDRKRVDNFSAGPLAKYLDEGRGGAKVGKRLGK